MTTEYLLDREVENVLACLMPSNRAVCRVSIHTGLRVSDVLSLRKEQLKPRFWVREQKTGKAHLVGLPRPLLEELRRIGDEEPTSPWVFPKRCKPQEHRTRQAVWKDVKRAAAAYRIPTNVGTHTMRKIYAVNLMRKFGDLDRVRRALNHGNMTTTLIYTMAGLRLDQRLDKLKRASTRS